MKPNPTESSSLEPATLGQEHPDGHVLEPEKRPWWALWWPKSPLARLVALCIYGALGAVVFSLNAGGNRWAEILVERFTKETKQSPPTPDEEYIPLPAPKEDALPAVEITFADGIRAFVDVSITVRIRAQDAARAIVTYGTPQQALADLKAAFESAMFEVLEGVTVAEARSRRNELETKILGLTQGAQDRTGYEITSSQIRAIRQASLEPSGLSSLAEEYSDEHATEGPGPNVEIQKQLPESNGTQVDINQGQVPNPPLASSAMPANPESLGEVVRSPRKVYLDERSDPPGIIDLLDSFDADDRRVQAAAHFHGKWIAPPGWHLTVSGVPEFRDYDAEWIVPLQSSTLDKEVTVYAINSDPSLSRWRPSDHVLLQGQIREVRLNPFIYVHEAVLTANDVEETPPNKESTSYP